MDSRIKYTKKILKETLLETLKTKSIDEITVTEICTKANINRATFYKYYENNYDLLKSIKHELKSEIENDITYNTKESLNNIFKTLQKNQEISKFIVNNDKNFINELINHVYTKRPQDKEYIYLYIANGTYAIIEKWIKSNFKDSIEEIINTICSLLNKLRQ